MIVEFFGRHLSLVYEMSGVFGALGAMIFVGGLLIAYFDRVSLEDAIYFAFITAFTVGIGDLAPKSRGARIITVLLSAMGLLLMGIAVAIAVHALHTAIEARAH
jgi:voltage-gated potassium channel